MNENTEAHRQFIAYDFTIDIRIAVNLDS
jgi:hypothetical protein